MRFFTILFGITMLSSCSQLGNVSSEVAKLDSLLTEVNAAEKIYEENIPHEEIGIRLDSLKKIVSFAEGYSGEMSLKDANMISKYNDTKNIIKKFKSRSPQIKKEIERTIIQLTTFREALNSKATKDKNGRVIDKLYIEKEMRKETEAAEYLVKSIKELDERSQEFLKMNESRLQEVLPYVNALK